MNNISKTCMLVIILVAIYLTTIHIIGCNKYSDEQYEKLQRIFDELSNELETIRNEARTLREENRQLRETPGAAWKDASEQKNKGALKIAQDKFKSIVDKYPTSEYTAKARDEISRLELMIKLREIMKIEESLVGAGRQTFEEATTRLKPYETSRNIEVRKKARSLSSAVEKRLLDWPIEMSPREFQLRYHDLIGKKVSMYKELEISNYYNWGFKNPAKFYSFEVKDEDIRGHLNVFCRKKDIKCKELFEARGGYLKIIISIPRKYYNKLCDRVALLVSWE